MPHGGETDVERIIGINDIFFSTTDLKGVITGANKTFSSLARFPFTELLRAPHSIIRSPDMPGGVFKIMWDRLDADLPVAAYVKNKAKDGLFYWVFATVTPISGGYLSVRTRPLCNPLWDAANALYQSVRPQELAARDKGARRTQIAEVGEELLGNGLRDAGFSGFEEFMMTALPEEVSARQQLVERHVYTPGNDPLLAQITAGGLELDERIEDLLQHLGTLGELAREMHTAVVRNKHTRELMLRTAESAQSAVKDRTGAHAQLSASADAITEWVKRACDALAGLVDLLAPVEVLAAEARFSIALARLHNEMVLNFSAEVEEEGTLEGASSIGHVPLLCEGIVGDVERLSEQLAALKYALELSERGITDALEATQRTQQFLASWQLLVARLGLEDLHDVTDAINVCQEGILSHALELSGLATSCTDTFNAIDAQSVLEPLPMIRNGAEALLR